MAGRGLSAEHRKAIKWSRESLLNIDPMKILWGEIDRESIPRAEVAEARESIGLGFEVWAPNVGYDGSDYWLIDGEATLSVALDLQVKTIPVCVHMDGREGVARSREQLARFRAENPDDPEFLTAIQGDQGVVIKVSTRGRPKGGVESNPSVAEPEPSEPEPIPVDPSPVQPPPSTFSDQFRAIIRRDSRTIYAIETAAGVPRGGVGRFLSGERGLTTDTLDRLAVVLGISVIGPDLVDIDQRQRRDIEIQRGEKSR
jgi:hypothetical protein